MRRSRFVALTGILALTLAGGIGSQAKAAGKEEFSFNAPDISGFPGGRAIALTGGGAYSVPDFIHAGGSFDCTSDIAAGLFNECQTGQGVRWDTDTVLPATMFKCTGAASEPLKAAETGDKTVVMLADFYRAGDGTDESFTAQMIVSETDLDPDTPGIQNIWVQQVGCGTANVHFN